MTNNPMLPTNEQLKKWEDLWLWFHEGENIDVLLIEAYQAGADAQLEVCCDVVGDGKRENLSQVIALRSACRPKPPSLKMQALDLLDKAEDPSWDINDFSIVREALEQLPEDKLCATHRPKPPSLADEALIAIEMVDDCAIDQMRNYEVYDELITHKDTIVRALELLKKLEGETK